MNSSYNEITNEDRILNILDEVRDISGVDQNLSDYHEQYDKEYNYDSPIDEPGYILVDSRGDRDLSTLNALYDIARDENRSLEDRGAASAIIDCSKITWNASHLDDERDACLVVDANRASKQIDFYMEDLTLGYAGMSVPIGPYSDSDKFSSTTVAHYSISPHTEIDDKFREQREEIEKRANEICDRLDKYEQYPNIDFKLNELRSYLGNGVYLGERYDDSQYDYRNFNDGKMEIYGNNIFSELIDYSTNTEHSEEMRSLALACAMSSISHEEFHESQDSTYSHLEVDQGKLISNIDYAKDVIETGRIEKIEISHIYHDVDNNRDESLMRSLDVNAPTAGQKYELDVLSDSSSYENKLIEYFPDSDLSKITYSDLKEKMDNDPDVLHYREELSRDILWSQAEFVNEHTIVIDRTGEDRLSPENPFVPIHDLPDGTHFDVCIQKTYEYDDRYDVNISFDSNISKEVVEKFDAIGREKDDYNYILDGGQLKGEEMNYNMSVKKDDFNQLRDILSDIAHEHSLQQERTVEPEVELASQVKEEKSFDELMMDVRKISGGWDTIHRDDDVDIHDFINEDGYVDIKSSGAFHNLIDYASNPQHDDDIRGIALASAMNMQIQYVWPADASGPKDHSFVDYDGAKQSLDYAKDIISSGKLVEIEAPVSTYFEKTGMVYQEPSFSQTVNGITIQQNKELNILYKEDESISRKLDEYFPGVDKRDISCTMLKEKMDNDPEVCLMRDNISQNITRNAEFSNDHIIVVNRTDTHFSNVLGDDKFKEYKDLPNGEHYDVCIEKISGTIPGVKITYDKEMHDDMLKAIDNFAKENHNSTFIRGIGISDGDHEMLLTPYQIMEREDTKSFVIYPNDNELERIKDIVTDVAHEHSIEMDIPEHEKDVTVYR